MSEITLRPAQARDAMALSAHIHATIDASYPPHYGPDGIAHFKAVHTPSAIADRIARGLVLLIEEAGAVLATGCLDGDRIFGVFVDPARQGCGFGRRIMDALEAAARARGLVRVVLYASLPAEAFYRSLGYDLGAEIVKPVGQGGSVRFRDAFKTLGA